MQMNVLNKNIPHPFTHTRPFLTHPFYSWKQGIINKSAPSPRDTFFRSAPKIPLVSVPSLSRSPIQDNDPHSEIFQKNVHFIRNQIAHKGFGKHVGLQVKSVSPGTCELLVPFRKELSQPMGYLHGGAVSMLLDSAAGCAAFTITDEKTAILTVESKTNMLRPGIGDTFVAKAKVVKAGKNIIVVQADLYGESQDQPPTHCATSLQTLMRVPMPS